MNDTTLVFISGAGLQKYIWDDLAGDLKLPSVVIEYTKKYQKLDDYVNSALEQLAHLDTMKFIIVAHSAGGVIGVEVAKRLGDRLVGFIAISAVIPKPSQSFLSSLPIPQKFIMPLILKIAGTTPPESSIRSSLAKDLSTEQQDKIVHNFRSEGIGLYKDKTSAIALPAVPSLYIVTTADSEFTESFQVLQANNLHDAVVERVATGHLPMMSDPHQIAKLMKTFLS